MPAHPFAHFTDLSHRDVHAQLVLAGWNVCGIGDWAIVLRSPDGKYVARICPFEPAFGVFVALCQQLNGHSWLPHVEADVPLEGGGQLTVMEFLIQADTETYESVKHRWESGTDAALRQLRECAEQHSAQAEETIAWWGGLDLNAGNVMMSVTGEPKLVDLFYVDGRKLFETLLHDPKDLGQRIPKHRRKYMTDIAAISRSSTSMELLALREAAAVAGWEA